MYRSDRGRPYSKGDPDMYDESHYGPEQRQSSPRAQYGRDTRNDYRRSSHFQSDDGNFGSDGGRRNHNDDIPQYNSHTTRSRSPRHDGGSRRYTDRDREEYGPSAREKHDSRSPGHGQSPNRTVVLEGLPTELTKEDIKLDLEEIFGFQSIEEVRLILDKVTGQSRRFAFVQFLNVEAARALVESDFPNVPHNSKSLNSGRDLTIVEQEWSTVRASYSRDSRAKGDRLRAGEDERDWECDVCHINNYAQRVICFRCNAPRPRSVMPALMGVSAQQNISGFSGFATTGDSDVSTDKTASQFLLLRGLEPGVTEDLLAKGVSKLYRTKTDQSQPATGKKAIMSTQATDANLGAKEGSLQRVLLVRDRKSNDSWRYGFAEFSTVEDAQAAMAKFSAAEKFTISSKPVLVNHIHAGVFVPVLQAPSPEYEKFVFSPLHNPAAKLMYWDEAGYLSVLNVAKPVKSDLEMAKERLSNKMAAAASKEGFVKDGDGKAKKRKAERETAQISKKVVAPHLQYWSNRHAELHGLPAKEDTDIEGTLSEPKAQSEDSPPSRSFADLNRKCCLLCARQFKSDAEVHKHERVSKLHQDNMNDQTLVAKAIQKLIKAGVSQPEEDVDSSAYRDRAKERRQAFNQPKQPAPQKHNLPKRDEAPKEEEVQPVSKGAALLGKMGWTEGSGLGAQGTGRTEAIATELYASRVGLGAEGAKIGDAVEEANRSTQSNYGDFVQKSRDKAKERYEKMA